MDFKLDGDQELIVGTVRRFADRELANWAPEADRAGEPPPKLLDAAGELGLLIDAVPEAAGGMLEGEFSHLSRALRGYELGRACAALAALCETNVEPALAVRAWGSDEARAGLYAALSDGRLATTANDWRGRLEVTADAGGATLSGTLGPVPALAGASHLLLLADRAVALVPLDGASGVSGVAVEAHVPSGWRAARWGTATFTRAKLPASLVLATGDAVAAARRRILSWYRLSLAARAAGVAHAAMAHAARYGAERVQFGQPIGTFQSLAHLQDANETAADAARLMVLEAAWRVDTGAANEDDAASRARAFCAGVVRRATIDAVQIYGGYGYVNDYPVEKLMRDARAFEVLGGNEQFERVLARGPQE